MPEAVAAPLISLCASEALLRDLANAIAHWQAVVDSDAQQWPMRTVATIHAMVPVVLFLEQAGERVSPGDLLTVDALQAFLVKGNERHGERFVLICSQLQNCLDALPGFKPKTGPQQMAIARDHYRHIAMHLRNLRAVAALGG